MIKEVSYKNSSKFKFPEKDILSLMVNYMPQTVTMSVCFNYLLERSVSFSL